MTARRLRGAEPAITQPAGAPAFAEMRAVAEWPPVGVLLLARDGEALGANAAWTGLSGIAAAQSHGQGWIQGVRARERTELRARLRKAVLTGRCGAADVGLANGQGSRWWWRPGPADGLIIGVISIGDTGPAIREAELTNAVVHRLFGVGLAIEFAIGISDSPARSRLQDAVDELDSVIRDIRAALFSECEPTDVHASP